MPPSSNSTSGRRCCRFGAGVPWLGGIEHRGARPQVLGAQHGLGGGSQQHNDVAVGDGGQSVAGPHRNLGPDLGGQRRESG